ncbi:MAG: hypothetical protein Q9206_000206 [Seirophora lacunosa]
MPSGWAAQSSAYSDLHRITYARCNDMADYIGRLRTAQYRLGATGLDLPEFQLVYVLLAGLGVEFDSWTSGVRERSSVPSFELLGEELIEKFKNKSKPTSNQKVFLKRSCANCGLDHPLTVRVRRRCWAQSVASFQFRLIKELIDVKNFLVSKRLRKLELSETSSYHMYIMPS